MKFITLLTDFGTKDGYPGIMKGVIWGITPDAQVADITHSVSPQNIFEGALTLQRAVPFFPPGTVHIAVVDPGVGTARRPVAARIGEHFFIGPDNGLFTPLMDKVTPEEVEIVHLDRPQFWLPQVSHVFHGRDIFAPAGAYLAGGVPLSELGSPIQDPVRLNLPVPAHIPGGWRGQVIHVDSFGNLGTNLTSEQIGSTPRWVRIAGATIKRLSQAFGDGKPGDLVALIDSDGKLSVAVVNGNAAVRLGIGAGAQVELVDPTTSQ